MKKFKFRLEKVLQYRLLVKDEKKRALLQKNQELQLAKNKLEYLQKAALSNELDQRRILSVEEVLLSGLFAEKIKEDIIKQRLEIIRVEGEVEAATQEYIEASKESRSLEMLRERKLQQFNEYLQKEDEKFLDELAVQRYGRGEDESETLNHGDR